MKATNVFFYILSLIIVTSCQSDPLLKMPGMNLRLSDSTTVINTASIPEDKRIMLVHFNSDCIGCQKTTVGILQNYRQFKDMRIYFITTQSMERLRVFYKHYKLKFYPNIIAGQDYESIFPKYFNTHLTPFIAVYSKEKRLEGILKGSYKIETIIEQVTKPRKI